MKIALAQLNYHIGNFEKNTSLILQSIARAKASGADLVIFAELSVCGYPPRDFLQYDYFVDRCELALQTITSECKGIAAILGIPTRNKKGRGKSLYNSAILIDDGKVTAIRHKMLLPTYDVFDENRYFEKGTECALIEFKEWKIALTICEDLWNVSDEPLYDSFDMDELMKQGPDFIVNIAASPFSNIHAEERKAVFVKNSIRYHLPLFFVNHIGSQTELIFDGGSMVVDSSGRVIDELAYFHEDLRMYELSKINNVVSVTCSESVHEIPIKKNMEQIHDALILGIKDYFRKLGFEKAIIGLSGGIDSAVTLVLATHALGKENVCAVLLPSSFSSSHSVKDAEDLVANLGVEKMIIPIGNLYDSFLLSLSPFFKDLPFGLAEENLQARIRGTLLMALSNKFGYILLNTSNKSELAVGYGTLYGDMCGGLSVLGDLYKTEVYALASYLNEKKEIIPLNTLVKEPSAELRPDQKDSDSLPEYDVLDKVLFQYIEQNRIDLNSDKKMVSKVLGMVNTSEYKRYQAPPILRVSQKSFGMGRRMPIVAKYSV